ncbi:cadherin-like domain-containing protein, partial [Leeuwenhoekiella sp. W20_SRS_FM14]|uniref:cadherin-like domain-containing protein n=1 Tax=Leeuwenhoekiella sp. W20_SRS_FM14 TaxID=3240270 RepID=UPI003F9BF5DD
MKKTTFTYFLVSFFIFFSCFTAFSQRSCNNVSLSPASLDFQNPTFESGSNNNVANQGDIYRFSNVAPGVDARVTITQLLNGATLPQLDRPALIEGSDGFDRAFQPTLRTNGANSGARFNIQYVITGTNTPVTLNFNITALDVDGNNVDLRERVQLSPLPDSYSHNNPTGITFANNATILQGTATTVAVEPGTGVSPQFGFSSYYEGISQVSVFILNVGGAASNDRQFAILFEDIAYPNRVDNNFTSPLICGTVRDNLGNPIAGVTLNLTGGETQTTTTAADGSYSFTLNKTGVVTAQSYTITQVDLPNYLSISDVDGGNPNVITRTINTKSSLNNDFVDGLDDDGDGVLNVNDICPGFDDNVDTDGDGVPNGCDVDDDNDGILDIDEESPCIASVSYEFYDLVPAGLTVDNIPTSGALATGTVGNFDVNSLQNTVDPGDTDTYAIRYTGLVNIATADTYTFFTNSDDGSKLIINGIEVVNNDGDHGPREASGAINLNAGLYPITVLFYENGGGAVLTVSYQSSTISKTALPFSILSCGLDSDADGTPDYLDSDSDNDGCSDANEAYGDANADGGDNEFYGTGNPPSTNPNGTVQGATYPGTNVNVTTAGAAPVLSAQPTNKLIDEGQNTQYSITATGASLSYQWQVSTDAGNTFTNLSNGGIYAGVNTATLNLTNVNFSFNNSRYRVIVTSANNICTPVTSTPASLTINRRPVAVDDANTVIEDTPRNVANDSPNDLLQNDTDADGNTITITAFTFNGILYSPGAIATVTGVGTLQINANGSYLFTPALNFVGTIPAITYTISDGRVTDTANLTLTMVPVNDAPIAVTDNYTTDEDTSVILTPLTGDSDVDNDPLTITSINGTNLTPGTAQTINVPNGVVTIAANGIITFTPALNFNGSVTFPYRISDGNGGTATANQAITITPVNDNPVAVNDSYTTNEDTPVILTPLTGDSDVDNDVLSITSINGTNLTPGTAQTIAVTNGSVSIAANGTITFTPAPNFNGTVTFPYVISDGNGGTATANEIITVNAVNDNPVAVNDNYSTNEDTPIILTPLDGDSDADNDALTITQINGTLLTPGTAQTIAVTNASITIAANGTITFTPVPDFNGNVTFPYTISDGNGGTATANEIITVNPVNDNPIANPDLNSTRENTTLTVNAINGILSNDTDIDNDALEVTTFTIANNATIYNANSVAPITGIGTLQINDDGSYEFIPEIDYFGPVPVATYSITDGNSGSASSTLTLVINADSDGDGIADIDDLDSDNDGILDTIEGQGIDPTADADADGVPNYLDSDFAALDANGIAAGFDFDGDGLPNHLDLDADNDAIPDVLEAGLADTDNDGLVDTSSFGTNGFADFLETSADSGTPNFTVRNTDASSDIKATLYDFLDRDSDNDGLSDTTEAFSNNNSYNDTDNDGIVDGFTDTDNNGWHDAIDAEVTFPAFLNSDTDALPNYLDLDSDGDGLPDTFEGNFQIVDGDNNGIVGTGTPADSDEDGLADTNDRDFGGNVLDNFGFNQDRDGDGINNYIDIDIDNDGIIDNIEGQSTSVYVAPLGTDTDSDGIDDAYDVDNGGAGIGYTNTDGGSAPDYADVDSENDGIFDYLENNTTADDLFTQRADGILEPNQFTDSDGDGLADIYDTISGTGTAGNATNGGQTPNDQPDLDPAGGDRDWREASAQDNDGDGINDIVDLDDDNDGILDTDEDFNEDGDNNPRTNPSDKDGDGIPNYFDLDTDNDGIPDYREAGGTDDPDGNGQPGIGVLDNTEVNDNGIPLAVTTDQTSTDSNLAIPNTAGTNNPDFIDLDSDNDGIVDAIEAGGTDVGGDGRYGAGIANDADADGLADILDPYDDREGNSDKPFGVIGIPLPVPDTDGDGFPDYLDLDSDDDTIPDNVEGQSTLGYRPRLEVDSDKDGLDDAYDSTDNVGIPIIPVNTDGTDVPDYLDLDSDNDFLFDIVEAGNATADTDNDGQTNTAVGNNGLDNNFDNADTYVDVNGILDDTQADNFPDEDADVNTGGDVDYRDIQDTDGDGVADAIDLDDDNDGILDTAENGGIDPTLDSDGDGIPNYKDSDSTGFVDSNLDFVDDNFDTDLDGIIDQYDSDSDGDGCNDANEAYNSGSADADGNGYYGTGNPPAVNTDGTVIGASYPGTNANVTTAGAAPVIDVQPADQSINEGENATFSVNATGATLNFQWQLSTDNGATFTDLANGGIYSGTTTSTLNLTAVPYSHDNYQYQVIVTDNSYICDFTASTPPALLSVNGLPVAVDNSNTTFEDVAITVLDDSADDLLQNDTDADGDLLTIVTFTFDGVSYNAGDSAFINGVGTLTINVNGSYSFVPSLNYNGTLPTITYTITDGIANDTANLNITVIPTPDAVDDTFTTNEDTAVDGNLFADNGNGTDDLGVTPTTAALTTGTTNGTLVVNANGNFTYTPNADFNGIDSFTYTITDANGQTSTATATITITPTPDAVDDLFTTFEDTQVSGNLFDDNGNGTDDLGSLPTTAILETATTNGNVTVNPNGTFTYLPNENFNGTDSFEYTITDTNGQISTATAIVTVIATPDAANDSFTTNEDTQVSGNLFVNNGNGIDDLGTESTTAAIETAATNGTAVVNTDGTFTYTPNDDFNGIDSFNYTITDTNGQTSTATATITIIATPDAVDDAFTTNEDTAVTGNLFADNGSGIDDLGTEPTTAAIETAATNGTTIVNIGGTFTYTPNADFNGIDSFTYTITDDNGQTSTATATITITPVVDIVADTDTTLEDTAVTTAVLDNDTFQGTYGT